jgi:hypothetical protein
MPRPRRFLLLLLTAAAAAALIVPFGANARGGSDARPVAKAAQDVTGWDQTAASFRGRNGERFTANCPSYGSLRSVWGTDIYTDDSGICSAAVHVGVISLAGGGLVTFEIRPGEAAYTASTRNRVTSSAYGAWSGSFVIVTAVPTYPGIGDGGSGWTANAAQFRNWYGAIFEFDCPPNGTASTVWGTNIYTDDSSVCTAAVHGGLITLKKGGKVKIQIREGLTAYRASTRNGIRTNSYPAWPASFIVVDAPDGPETPEGYATGDVLVNGKPFSYGPVRYGSTVDVTRGTLTLTAAKVGSILTNGNGTEPAKFKLNKIAQRVRRKRVLSAELALVNGDFQAACGSGGDARASQKSSKVVRSLWANGKGRFRTKGRYSVATIRGTKWQTTDQCDGTLTTVAEGSVVVRDVPRKRNVIVRAGRTYLAQAR